LDGLRAAAAYAVIAAHVGFLTGQSQGHQPWAPVLARFDSTVTIFFALSGFLLYRPFALHAFGQTGRPSWSDFWRRRATRIFPAYWVSIIVIFAFLSTPRPEPRYWFSYLTMTHTYVHQNLVSTASQMWTMTVEVPFYLLMPFMAALVQRGRHTVAAVLTRQSALLGGLVAIGIVWDRTAFRIHDPSHPQLLWLPAYVDWFAVGMALAVLSAMPETTGAWERLRRDSIALARDPLTCWVVAVLLFWIATLPLAGPRGLEFGTEWQWTTAHYLYLAMVFMILLPLTLSDGGWVGRILGGRTGHLLGALSYGIYLWHVALMLLLQRMLGIRAFDGHFWMLYLLTCAVSTGVAAVSWFAMERPLLQRFSRGWRRSPIDATVSATMPTKSKTWVAALLASGSGRPKGRTTSSIEPAVSAPTPDHTS
jgi:peptidoglycan/LPS O-acetylase OafA/YrhL